MVLSAEELVSDLVSLDDRCMQPPGLQKGRYGRVPTAKQGFVGPTDAKEFSLLVAPLKKARKDSLNALLSRGQSQIVAENGSSSGGGGSSASPMDHLVAYVEERCDVMMRILYYVMNTQCI